MSVHASERQQQVKAAFIFFRNDGINISKGRLYPAARQPFLLKCLRAEDKEGALLLLHPADKVQHRVDGASLCHQRVESGIQLESRCDLATGEEQRSANGQ